MSNEQPLDNKPVENETSVGEVENITFIEDAPMQQSAPVKESTGPTVDPTNTFNDWTKFDAIGFESVGYGETREDFIPLPSTDIDGYKVLRPNPQVELRKAMFATTPARKDLFPMFVFKGTDTEFYDSLVHYDIAEQRKKRNYDDEYSATLDQAGSNMVPDNYLWKSQWRTGARWTNVPTLGGKALNMGPQKNNTFIGSVQSSVEDHRLGVNVLSPMWHSGFHVRLRTPTAKQLSELDAVMASEKNIFGRRTGGALFANQRCYLESAILDLFIDCIETVNIQNWTPEMVRRLLDGRDIQLAALALQAARYPTNYPSVEPCVEAEAGCRNIKHSSFTPINSLIVDEARFTSAEIRHMNERYVLRTEQEVIAYQQEASWNRKKTIEITPTLHVRLKHARATDIIDSGYVWAASVSNVIARVLGEDSPSRNRVTFIENLLESESLRRFMHYIDGVIQDGEEKPFSENEFLALLELIGDDQQIIRRFELDVRNFEDEDIIAYMATPRYLCADCEKRLSTKDPEALAAYNKNPIMVPQDAVSRFFMSRRLS